MKLRQQGFTVVELIISVVGIVVAVAIGTLGYVLFHFVSKFW